MLTNTRESYGLVAQLLHWTTALLILALLPLGVYMTDLPQGSADEVVYKAWVYSWHKTIGVTVLFVAIVRVIWAIVQPHPKLLNSDRKLESLVAQTVHWLLYGAIICMPLTGWLQHSAAEGFAPFWLPLPQDLPFVPKDPHMADFFGIAHVFTAILLVGALALHIVGALKHAVIDRDGALRRMTPGLKPLCQANLSDPYFHRLPAALAALAFLILGAVVAADYFFETQQSNTMLSETAPTADGDHSWIVDWENSRLEIQIIQMGNPVLGDFGSWYAAINFDPENIETAHVEVDVELASILIGSVSDQAKGVKFLNAAAYPVAKFVTKTFVQIGPGSYEAQGDLSLAGTTQQILLPFTLKIENDRAYMSGEVTLERLAFGIGENGFVGDSQLGFGVLVKVTLEAEKPPTS